MKKYGFFIFFDMFKCFEKKKLMDIEVFVKLVNCIKKIRKIKKLELLSFGENVNKRNYYDIF